MNKNKILIVDDEATPRQLMSLYLKKNTDYEIIAVKDGKEAVKLIDSMKDNLPDLILLDIEMPGMGGEEVARILKANSQTNNIPIIFIISANNIEQKVRAYQAGGIDYITKPLDVLEILNRVQTQIKLKLLIDNL